MNSIVSLTPFLCIKVMIKCWRCSFKNLSCLHIFHSWKAVNIQICCNYIARDGSLVILFETSLAWPPRYSSLCFCNIPPFILWFTKLSRSYCAWYSHDSCIIVGSREPHFTENSQRTRVLCQSLHLVLLTQEPQSSSQSHLPASSVRICHEINLSATPGLINPIHYFVWRKNTTSLFASLSSRKETKK